ncbi:hypothetical protein C4F51_08035 [Cellvibrio sp. KB43]|uniref:Mannose-6-phosphate isomerase n=1 Tax=Cellvibrio polysaccharolyticus TaxID=2082724 RepID=A0A928YU70_9GAMM|nr:hypothetical protein [Cellvibrio polysaccharolyticus]
MARVYSSEHPHTWVKQQIARLLESPLSSRCFVLQVVHRQTYLSPETAISLLAPVVLEKTGNTVQIFAAILPDTDSARESLTALASTPRDFENFATEHHLPWLNLQAPLNLKPVFIAKPWGREVWYTGIEVRGQSLIEAQGQVIPLPWLLAVFPFVLANEELQQVADDLILLKILDPLPDDVYGDLYFEVHDEKREVYVVTAVDENAWPAGYGAIRLGFDQEKRQSCQDDEAFRRAYLQSVQRYREVRVAIDEQFDQRRVAEGLALLQPVSADTLKRWQDELPAGLQEQEKSLRQQMDAFTALQPLKVGDVVKIPCGVPHALQHGVRTVEFQTPVYERNILSFAQKVLTQTAWDTEKALPGVSLDQPDSLQLDVLQQQPGKYTLEQVAAFDDFVVQRLTLLAGQTFDWLNDGRYALLLLIQGKLALQSAAWSQHLDAADAINPASLVPATLSRLHLRASAGDAIILLARPVDSAPLLRNS